MIKEFENQIEGQFNLLKLNDNQLMGEIRTNFSTAVMEMELNEASYEEIIIALGTPKEFIYSYLEGRGLGEINRKNNFATEPSQDQSSIYKMRSREPQLVDFKIPQNLILIILIIPACIALSVIPIFFLPIFSYYTLYETWGIDDTFITIFLIMFFPFWFEILTGATGKQPLNVKKMELLRNSYRLSYLLIHVTWIVSIFWHELIQESSRFKEAYPLIIFFEIFVIIRELFLTPLNLTQGFERKESYKIYLAFLILSMFIVPVMLEL